MRLRNRWARWTSIAVLVAAVSLLAAACGGGGSKNSEGTTTTTSSGGSSQQKTFAKVAAYADRPMTYTDGTSAERLRGREITSTYFETLGITPAMGRNSCHGFTMRTSSPPFSR